MKKFLSVIILLSCIVPSMFAKPIMADISTTPRGYYRTITVTDDEKGMVLIYTGERDDYGKFHYAIEWYDDRATVEEIKEWKEFAKLFVEEDIK